ncbi:MAG: hypothetical protein IPG61_09740 [bacterium]|nr:hypothetical protein [bacterium]
MPQEIVVPVVRVAHVRGRSAEATRIDYVGIQILGGNHKITTPKHRFEFIQTAKVSGAESCQNVRAAIYEGARPVTSVALVTFDSTSDSLDERKRTVVLELGAGEYDKKTAYRLVLRDAETDASAVRTGCDRQEL